MLAYLGAYLVRRRGEIERLADTFTAGAREGACMMRGAPAVPTLLEVVEERERRPER